MVTSFLNERNETDQQVYELLEDKGSRFCGALGSFDDVLDGIESDVDSEKRFLAICDLCSTRDETEVAFEALQDEVGASVDEPLAAARHLLKHFDEEFRARLEVQFDDSREQLDHVGRMLWVATRHVLQERTGFGDARDTFALRDPPCHPTRPGTHTFISRSGDNVVGEFLLRLSHALGEHAVAVAKSLETPLAQTLDISRHPTRISVAERLKVPPAWLVLLAAAAIESFEREEYLPFSRFRGSGESVDSEICSKLLHSPGLDYGGTAAALRGSAMPGGRRCAPYRHHHRPAEQPVLPGGPGVAGLRCRRHGARCEKGPVRHQGTAQGAEAPRALSDDDGRSAHTPHPDPRAGAQPASTSPEPLLASRWSAA